MIPFFTAVIPVYNKAPHIKRSISSVLNQTFGNLELIVIDDASTDASLSEINKFNDPRIRVFNRIKPGPGGYAARNLGIKEAKADWVAFLDADDEWMPDHLQNVYNLTKKYPDIRFFSCARLSKYNEQLKLDNFAKEFRSKGPVKIDLKLYLQNTIKGQRAVGTNAVCINKHSRFASNLFPEGKTDRSGDLFAWVYFLAKEKTLVWSPHIASISHRDSVNMVSIHSLANIYFFHDLVTKLKKDVSPQELVLLKKYINRLVKNAWFNKKEKGPAENFLGENYYWRNDFFFCLKTQAISLIPRKLFYILKRIKHAI